MEMMKKPKRLRRSQGYIKARVLGPKMTDRGNEISQQGFSYKTPITYIKDN